MVDQTFARLSGAYLRALKPALHHRGFVLAGATVFFLLSLGIIKLLNQEFVPAQDSSRFSIRFQIS